jgi:hypothetical protein
MAESGLPSCDNDSRGGGGNEGNEGSEDTVDSRPMCYICWDPTDEPLIIELVCKCRNQPVHESCLREMQRVNVSNECRSCRQTIKKPYREDIFPLKAGRMERAMSAVSTTSCFMCIIASATRIILEMTMYLCFLSIDICTEDMTNVAIVLDHTIVGLLAFGFFTFVAYKKLERTRNYIV